MTPDAARRIGQLVWPALRASRGRAGLEALAPLLERFPPGGVIVFGEGEPDVAGLLELLRDRVDDELLVAADLERGCGQQVREWTSLPPAMAIAASPLADAAHRAGLLTGHEARAAGIDVVLAPVVDVNTAATNPIIATRAFGDDPHAVARLGSDVARGLAEGGALAVAKHFPGHGRTVQDSHTELARVTATAEELDAVDLLPFRTLVAEGVGGIMVGHLEVPALDPVAGRPATASPAVVLDHLRRRLGYDGLVVTDALDMGGFRPEPLAALDALQSGCDVLLMPADPLATCEALLDAYERRFLPDEVLDAAVARVETARRRVRAVPRPVVSEDERRSARAFALELLGSSLTQRGPPLPVLAPGSAVDLQVYGDDDGGMVVPAFSETLEAGGVVRQRGAPGLGFVLTSVKAWQGSSRLAPLHRERLAWAAAHGRLAAVVVLGSPYELLELPDTVPAVGAYQPTPDAAAAAARVLLGRADAPGRLPVRGSRDGPGGGESSGHPIGRTDASGTSRGRSGRPPP